MKEKFRELLKVFFRWIFKDEIHKLSILEKNYHLNINRLTSLLNNIDVSIDVHENIHQYSPSWAVISIQGEKADYIKFINLGNMELREIQKFLRQFEKSKVDATPSATMFLKFNR